MITKTIKIYQIKEKQPKNNTKCMFCHKIDVDFRQGQFVKKLYRWYTGSMSWEWVHVLDTDYWFELPSMEE